jgi:predicted DNA-binding transcriptional regulator YafY
MPTPRKSIPPDSDDGATSRARNVSDLHRLLRIVTLLQSGRDFDHVSLGAALNVHQRTLFRDLRKIREVGIDITFNRKRGRFEIANHCLMQPLQLDGEEAMALAALCRDFAASEQIAFTRPAARALYKILAQLPEDLRRDVEETTRRTVIHTERGGSDADAYADVYEAVQYAILHRRVLECEYESARTREHAAEFIFEPYALFYSVRAWYAVGLHRGHGHVRSLKLSRFLRAHPGEGRFEMPHEFSLDAYLGNAWRMIKGDTQHQVELHFAPAIADTVAETNWHKTQETQLQDDGSLILRCTVDGLDEIVWWILSMGPSCRVVAPPQLVDRVRALAEEVAAMYPRAKKKTGPLAEGR